MLLVAMIGAIVLTLRHQRGREAPEHRAPGRRARPATADRDPQGPSRGRGSDHGRSVFRHYLTVAAILFTIGIFGIFLNRKNVIVILMSIELILLAVNINLVAFSSFLGDLVGQVFALSRADGGRGAKPRSALPFSSSTSATAAPSRSKTSIS